MRYQDMIWLYQFRRSNALGDLFAADRWDKAHIHPAHYSVQRSSDLSLASIQGFRYAGTAPETIPAPFLFVTPGNRRVSRRARPGSNRSGLQIRRVLPVNPADRRATGG